MTFFETREWGTFVSYNKEGNGVFRRLRHKMTIKALANWLN
ncbi:hypothetical protein ACVWYN_003685 [Pedobacter sp. UYP24]